ncbi:17-beta-hydroxysteroid dehydrogenase type 6-like isoform X1 [Mytilus californianus]|uniref:17-beta-hydroxysteroid dehydrogenase type 6-like isoform X1 n=1 Tax=Mytilus californianus TaxID=6549 RepID=UPI002245632B|nr:17-beta-hydroxysteroid dehydrogenase type 6-like isoform X1 [Mytilus californianus]
MHICVYGVILIFIVFISFLIFVYKLRQNRKIKVNGKSVFITGCDRGFGYHIAKQLSTLGFQVFAGCLDINGAGAKELENFSKCVHPVQIDVTKEQDVLDALKFVEDIVQDKGLWAVINNAGVASYVECEWCPLDVYQRLIDVNLTGVIRVTKAFLPLVRKNQGRVVTVASLAGRNGLPGFSAYSATKFGVIGFSECLRREMKKFNVKVITIEPSMYKTSITDENVLIAQNQELWEKCPDEIKNAYGEPYFNDFLVKIKENIIDLTANKDITTVIDAIEDAICCQYPDTRYVPGFRTSCESFIYSMLPISIQDLTVSLVMKYVNKPCQMTTLKKNR